MQKPRILFASKAVHSESSESIRMAGIMLQGAIHDFLELVGNWFLRVPWKKMMKPCLPTTLPIIICKSCEAVEKDNLLVCHSITRIC
jgi:hypothetical protein